MRVLLVILCCISLKITFTISAAKTAQCSITGFTLSLVTSRNRTGYWTSQVHLEHADDESSLPWNVKVDHNSAQCDGIENVGITATVSVQPGPGYQLVPGLGYYKMHTVPEKWDDARKICIQEGAHLLILNSGAEMDAVRSIWLQHQNITGGAYFQAIFVGVHDRFNEGEYITILDQPLRETGYMVWARNEPNNAGGDEDCLCIESTGGLNDQSCEWKTGFMCEHEL